MSRFRFFLLAMVVISGVTGAVHLYGWYSGGTHIFWPLLDAVNIINFSFLAEGA